jgi:2-polyprenyl-3-methyl-5-hydroxy-6-metoxy-1,4-benzoquinol methylase
MLRSLRTSAGAALDRRLGLLAPTRRLRFQLTMHALERFAGGRSLRVLDAGCGDGLLSESIARRHPDWTIVGVDMRSELLERARSRLDDADIANVELAQADLTQNLGEAVYDAVVAIECLVEIPDDDAALRMMAQALRPGGLLIAHVPQEDWSPVLPGSEATWRDEVRHGYRREAFAAQLRSAGLSVTRVHGTCHWVVRFAQEIRDRIKDAPPSVRALAFPLMALSVTCERYGIRLGESRALFAVARRAPE